MEICILDNGTQIPVQKWTGIRVLTIEDISKLQNRSVNSLYTVFSRTRHKLIENTDYFRLVGLDAIKFHEQNFHDKDSKKVRSILLITASGYAKLAAHMRSVKDEAVQKLIDRCYFANTTATPAQRLEHYALQQTAFNNKVERAFTSVMNKVCNNEKALANVQKEISELKMLLNKTSYSRGNYAVIDIHNWRDTTRHIVSTISNKTGMKYEDAYTKLYSMFCQNTGVRLATRMSHLRKKNRKVTILDIIASDKKLVIAFITILNMFAAEYDIDVTKLQNSKRKVS